jgi:hypothetical protein
MAASKAALGEVLIQTGWYATMVANWNLTGSYFEACSCEVVCPCIFESAPSHGDCSVLYAWHIEQGRWDGVALEGLNVVLAAYASGHMQKVKWLAALYLDQRGTQPQRDVLKAIFTGKAGGHPAVLAGFFERFIGVKSVPIEYLAYDKERAVRIPGLVAADVKAIAGQENGNAIVAGHPLCLAPGEPLVVAKSKAVTLSDYEWRWQFSDRTGGYSAFTYHS